MKKNTKRHAVLSGSRGFRIAAILLPLLLLCACGNASDTSGLAGVWKLQGAYDGDITVDDSSVESYMLALRLDADGNGAVIQETTEGRLNWTYDDGTLSVHAGGCKMSGTLKNGKLLLTPEGTEVRLVFSPQQEDYSGEDGPDETAVKNLSWYGWWRIDSSEGEIPTTWYDCCASFELNSDRTVNLLLWDETGSKTDPLSEIVFRAEADGTLSSLNGYFLYDEIHENEWRLDLSEETILLEELLHDAGEERFLYSIYLRPWGDLWKDTKPEQRPFYYDDWYLSMIAGKETMPDRIPWQDLEEAREQTKNDEADGFAGE